MKYTGEELENFDAAFWWRRYVVSKISKFIKGKKVLEVGSGLGSFSNILLEHTNRLTLLEPDKKFYEIIKKKFKNSDKIINIVNGTIDNIKNETFDAVVHFQVLEHIEKDYEEILKNINLINKGGFLIICVPSFMSLYSKFDKAVGHFRRYEKKDFIDFDLNKNQIIKMMYIDSVGYIIYKLFKLLLNAEYPKKFMIIIWDKIFIPISFFLDWITRYSIGKNLLVIIQKKNF